MQKSHLAALAGYNLVLAVYQSARGFYLGAMNELGPIARDSVEAWGTRKEAETALETGKWTQRDHP